ncbi:MAG: hypothetical protein ACLFRG_04065 [Desulfococcaceae bacterium]
MIIGPAVIALNGGAILVAGFGLIAAGVGADILRGWDLASGAEAQLRRERRTGLVSAVFARLLVVQFFSIFLFIHTADHLHHLFVGAMCAAGSLNVNPHGYPTLLLKLANLVLCGLWLILNHLDNQGRDYPLIRRKYRFLIGLSGLLLLEAGWQYRYFAGLRPNVITSCCGTLFGADAATAGGRMAGLPALPTAAVFFSGAFFTVAAGIFFLKTERGARAFAWASGMFLFLALAAIVSFISVYFYQLPTHHCPFCILQREYGHVGYALYLSLLAAAIPGMGVGLVEGMGRAESLQGAIRPMQRRLCAISLAGVTVFAAVSLYPMITGDFVYLGY